MVTLQLFILSGMDFGRMIIEGMRTDSLMFFGLRVSQWLSAILIALGILYYFLSETKKSTIYNIKKGELTC